jgi:hypothetical protein
LLSQIILHAASELPIHSGFALILQELAITVPTGFPRRLLVPEKNSVARRRATWRHFPKVSTLWIEELDNPGLGPTGRFDSNASVDRI